MDKPGGMLRGGIPHWHLPEEILDAEIAKLLSLGGIEIRCGVRAGTPDLTWDDLRNYDAAFLALGQDVGRRLDVPGSQARGVTGALEFLREAGLGRPVRTGHEGAGHRRRQHRVGRGPQRDQARRRRGHDRLAGVRRRAGDRARGPGAGPGRGRGAAPEHLLLRVLTEDGHVTGRRAVPGPAGQGRQRARSARRLVAGTEYEVECDAILIAIGQVQQLEWLPEHLSDRGLITADEHGRVDGNIFVGGDVLRGPSMVVDALGDGKRAARDIDRLLTAQALAPEPAGRGHAVRGAQLGLLPARAADPRTARRPRASAAAARRSRSPWATAAEQAVAEADRCMSCGVCNGCDNCYIVCPDVSVLRDARENGHYSIRTTYCKGCLVCVQECPTGCLEKVPEMDFDEPEAVTRMETAFAPYDGAHAEQSAFTRQLIEESIAEYDAERKVTAAAGRTPPNGSTGVTP